MAMTFWPSSSHRASSSSACFKSTAGKQGRHTSIRHTCRASQDAPTSHADQTTTAQSTRPTQDAPTPPSRSPPSAASYAAAAAALYALPAAGAVPLHHAAFPVVALTYFWLVNGYRFNRNQGSHVIRVTSLWPNPDAAFRAYLTFAGVVGVLIPLITLAATWTNSDYRSMIAPHTFLVLAQIWGEHYMVNHNWSMPVRLVHPIIFNSYRLWSLAQWCAASSELVNALCLQPTAAGGSCSAAGVWVAVLGWANMALWLYNLFWFLYLDLLPAWYKPEIVPTGSQKD